MKKQLVRILKQTLGEYEILIMEFIDNESYTGKVMFTFNWQRNLDDPTVRWYGLSIEMRSSADNITGKIKFLNRFLNKIDGNEDPHFIFAVLNCEQCQYLSEVSNFVGISDSGKYLYKFKYDGEGVWAHRLLKNDKEAQKLIETEFRNVKGINFENTFSQPKILTVNF